MCHQCEPYAKRFLICLLIFVLIGHCPLLWAAQKIDRIDLYDKSDNSLLFVTFDYDASGKNTGRSVFASDSTFLRHTTFQTDTQGAITREISLDFDSNTAFTTSLSSSSGITTFSVFDQFGLDQLGGPARYASVNQNTYDISQSNAAMNRIAYDTLNDGSLSRINVLDNAGTLLYYATVTHAGSGVRNANNTMGFPHPVIVMEKTGWCHMAFGISRRSHITLELFTILGRSAGLLFDKQLQAGDYSIRVPVSSSNKGRDASGVYVLRMSIDGRNILSRRGVVAR